MKKSAYEGDSTSHGGKVLSGSDRSWVMGRAHNPGKWEQLIAAIEARTGPKPEHAEEQKRIEKLVWWDTVEAALTDFPASNVFHIHPIGLVGNFMRGRSACECGCCLQSVFKVTRYGHALHTHYGPVFWGEISLGKSKELIAMRMNGSVSESEFRIVTAMSTNEGKIDAVQSCDSEIVTAGAMQKNINPVGNGEFPTKVSEFKAANESDYQELFEKCGWTVEGTGNSAQMFYIADYFQSDLGRATALDQSVNRPGYVARDIGKSLDVLLSRHPGLSRNPNEWGVNRAQYEREAIEHYGNSREMSLDNNGTSSNHRRYNNLLNNLA